MALSGSVYANKDLPKGYQPLLMVVITPQGSSTPVLLSSHAFDGSTGPSFPGIGILPAGNYEGRISQNQLGAIQHRSKEGIDRVSRVSLSLWDADHVMYNTVAKVYGFRGATMQVAVVFWEVGTTNWTSDAPVIFTGVCDMELPKQGLTVLEVAANTSHNTAVIRLPIFPSQNRCPLYFPTTLAERTQSTQPDSDFCIYSADVPSVGVGNIATTGGPGNDGKNVVNRYGQLVTDGNGVYIACEYIRSDVNDPNVGCMARLGNSATTSVAPDGDLGHDKSGRWTGGFAGVEWSPGVYYASSSNYTSHSRIATFSFLNAAILGQYFNLVYGQQFINGKVMVIVESGNDTAFEVSIYTGEHEVNYVPLVVVNGVEIGRFGHGSVDGSLGWDWVHDGSNYATGGRRGAMASRNGWNDSVHRYSALGDPFGSICRFLAVVYKDLFTGFGLPTVQVRTIGPKIPVFTSPSAFTLLGDPYNSNPAWVLLDLMIKANFKYPEMDIQTFIDGAAVCGYGTAFLGNASGTQVNYYDSSGNLTNHAAYRCAFALETRKSAAELLSGVLRCFNGYIYQDPITSLYCLGINQTLADQQPSTVPGSNYNTNVNSIHADGTSGIGHPAYSFDDTNINLKTITFEENATVTTPNRVQITFQDEDNGWVVDSLNETDPPSILRAGGALNPGGAVIDESLNVTGIPNFDQATRIANTYIAERQYGNEAGDARGTRVVKFQTTVRCVHLRNGHLVFWSNVAYGITRQLFRVIGITPSSDFQSAELVLQWHNDLWYTYSYGQNPSAYFSNPGTSRNPGPPRAWQPNGETPNVPAGNTFPQLTATESGFLAAENDGLDANGKALVQIKVAGMLPINQILSSVQPPRVPPQATLAGGGSIPAGKIVYLQLCSIDSTGHTSTASQTIVAPVTTGSNTINISGVVWPVNAVSYDLFAGYDKFSITHQQGGPVSSTISMSAMPNTLVYGPPDVNADSVYCRAKLVIHAGIIGSNVGNVTSTTVEIGGPASGTFTNVLSGSSHKLLLVGRQSLAGGYLPIVMFDATHGSGDGNTLTVDRNPSSLLFTQDVVVVSAQANIHSANTIGDVNFVSAYAPFGVSPDGSSQPDIGQSVRIIYGTGRGQVRTIIDVTASTGGTNFDTYTVGKPWNVEPDDTSTFIVEEVNWPDLTPTSQINAPFLSTTVVGMVNTTNYAKKVILVQAIIQDSGKTVEIERRAPLRLMYLTGSQGTRVISFADSPYTQSITDGILQVDTTGGNVIIQLLSYVFVPNVELQVQKVSGDANVVIINWATGESDWNGDVTRQLTSDAPPNNYSDIIFPGS